MKKLLAFTLAETLIVMGIIGVVAALTLPNLNSSTGDKEKVAKVKKIYQNLNDAVGRAEAVYGPMGEWFANDSNAKDKSKRIGERLTEFMKVSKNCAMQTNKGCFASTFYYLGENSGDNSDDQDANVYKVILADGTSIGLSGRENYLHITVDIDGPNKGASMYNRDIFGFVSINNKELLPEGYDLTGNFGRNDCLWGSPCTAWVIKNDNMDYLKVGNDGKCPNNVQLNWDTQTSCK